MKKSAAASMIAIAIYREFQKQDTQITCKHPRTRKQAPSGTYAELSYLTPFIINATPKPINDRMQIVSEVNARHLAALLINHMYKIDITHAVPNVSAIDFQHLLRSPKTPPAFPPSD